MRSAILGLSIVLAGCAVDPAPRPPPFSGAPPGAPAEVGDALVVPEIATTSAEPSIAAPPTPSVAPTPPLAHVVIEPAYKLEAMPLPKDKSAFQAELADRWRWNQGGMGELIAEVPPPDEHPMPRVIIDVTRVAGPHSKADVQRLARRNYWIRVIGCYSLGAYKDQKLRGKTAVSFAISPAGKIESTRTVSTTLADVAVATCLSDDLKDLEMPKAKGRTAIGAEIQIGPGDEPMPPPKDVIKPGDGVVDLEAARSVVALAAPSFEACYARAMLYAPELWGRIAVRFHVTEKGKLDEAFETESRFPDEAVTRCVLHHARELRFAKPQGGDARFVVPLRLGAAPQ